MSSSSGTAGAPIPALLNNRSIRPKRSSTAANSASTDSGSVTSVGHGEVAVRRLELGTSSSSSVRRPASTTVNPSPARRACRRPSDPGSRPGDQRDPRHAGTVPRCRSAGDRRACRGRERSRVRRMAKTMTVTRSAVIHAAPDRIFPLLDDLHAVGALVAVGGARSEHGAHATRVPSGVPAPCTSGRATARPARAGWRSRAPIPRAGSTST